MSLAKCKIVAFAPTNKSAQSRRFYEKKLGLKFISEDPFAIVFSANGIVLRIAKVNEFTPAPFTILGWEVADIEAKAKSLRKKRITFERYEGMEQDRLGIWTSPSGDRIAWFKDPCGNMLSISQH